MRKNHMGGVHSELAAISRLFQLGHRVATPIVDDQRVDLIVNYRTTVQVKSALLPNRRVRNTRNYSFNGGHGTKLWGPEVDLYLFHGRDENRWWVVPSDVVRTFGAHVVSSGRMLAWEERWDLFDAGGIDRTAASAPG